jgi:Ni/Co efflux regulator RcnB
MRSLPKAAAVLLLAIAPAAAAWVVTAPAAVAGARHMRRGDKLPAAVLQAGPTVDYAAQHLRRPPDGYGWFAVGGDMVMASLSSGLIVEVVEG